MHFQHMKYSTQRPHGHKELSMFKTDLIIFFFLETSSFLPALYLSINRTPSSLTPKLDCGIIFHTHSHMWLVSKCYRFGLKSAF